MGVSVKPVLVLGVGSVLYGDDGVGVEAVNDLAAEYSDTAIECIDGGVGGYGLIELLRGRSDVIIVDAVEMGAEPGTCRAFDPGDVELARRMKPLSLHQANVLDVIRLAREAGCGARVTIVGVQPESVAARMGLTERLSAGKKEITDFVRGQVAQAAAQIRGKGECHGKGQEDPDH